MSCSVIRRGKETIEDRRITRTNHCVITTKVSTMIFSALSLSRSRPQRFFEMLRPLPSERRGLGVDDALVPAWLGLGLGG